MKNSQYKYCGLTTINGGVKVRWANNLVLEKHYNKNGATRCEFVLLPYTMSKLDALEFIRTLPQFSSEQDQQAIMESTAYQKVASEKANGTYVLKKRGRPRKTVTTTVADVLNAYTE